MYSKDLKEVVLRLYENLNSLRKTALIFNIGRSTIQRWYKHIGNSRSRKKRKQKLEGRLVIDTIESFIKTNPFTELKQLQTFLKEQLNLTVSKELVRIALKRFGFSRKRARYYSIPKNDIEKLNNFLEKRNNFVKENRNFVSIDETSFGRNFLPASGYSKKGERLMVKRPFITVKTVSVLASVSPKFGIQYYKTQGSVNTDIFKGFLNLMNYPKGTVLLLDNVSFHKSKAVLETVKEKGWELLFVPPYSPVFNPIEGVFSIVKREYQKVMNIHSSFIKVSLDHIKSFFKHSFSATTRF
jgi:transposase